MAMTWDWCVVELRKGYKFLAFTPALAVRKTIQSTILVIGKLFVACQHLGSAC